MTIRPGRLIAIARRDLRMELAGRRGLGLPLVILGLLLPISGAPTPSLPTPTAPGVFQVSGDVPAAVVELPNVEVVQPTPGITHFHAGDRLETHGYLSAEIRAALDGERPAVRREPRQRPMPLPGRTLLFALISASTLTGAVSASIGGERSARTLVALLSAAVSRAEVVLGKWLAWGGLGVVSALGAAVVSIALGRVDAGWWLLPMVTVPLCAVALSLWLVRRASDVIGGTTVTLRVVPAVIGTGGLVAWFIGLDQPLVGASIPLGGALVAAGATWGTGALPALVATASTTLTTALLLRSTWNDLDEVIAAPKPPSAQGAALRTMVVAALCWWPPLLGPLLWEAAGNATLTATLPRGPGVIAAASGLGLAVLVMQARRTSTGDAAPRPSLATLALAVGVGVLLGLLMSGPLTPLPEAFGPIQHRLAFALTPRWGLVGLVLVAVSTEWMFRGWLTARAGPRWALVAWIVVCAPLDPLGGLISGLVLAQVAQRGGPWAATAAHIVWGLAALALISWW